MSIDRRKFLGLAGASLAAGSLGGCGVDKSPDEDVPQSNFDAGATAEDVTAGVDLKGKLAVVTGCTSGIGFETMRVLALRGAYVVGTSRSLSRAEEACKRVTGITTPIQMDLADLDSVVRCANDVLSLKTPLDFLICNAGYRGGGNDREIVNGVEKHFAINHLGHFVLVNRLLERMFLAWQARIVIVASRTSYTDAPDAGILFDDLRFTSDYDDAMAYGHSKLANVLFSLRLSELLRGTRITTNSLHPGVINTDIDRNLNAVTRFGFGILTALRGKTIEQGAATSCYVATAEALGATSGAYFEDCNAIRVGGHNHVHNRAMAARLLEASEALTADYLVQQQRPDWEKLKQ